ncbi:Gfo/Idh/MocA family protein [Lapidilactobacillus bayanensis]|uniref:Gfo/Idh/MocA family protein n=1 Tax=Lapidilactobacillus bayanensis TaxID=2485998 RepID=UPI000F77D27A|nr:Gfo/Idh/MocA family oxidoreductase [Lapidilactobacillus bayanensis]
MAKFRFGIMGTGNIANKFAEAVALIDDCEIVAVANRHVERAQAFAEKFQISVYGDDFEALVTDQELDAVYIATTTNMHYQLTKLCIKHHVAVICEKAMFMNSDEAIDALDEAEAKKVFVMEAMWSRFLPVYRQVLNWLADGKIGQLTLSNYDIGFLAQDDPTNRFFDPELGGGATYDLLVYSFELSTLLMGNDYSNTDVATIWRHGVDATDHVTLHYANSLATMSASFLARLSGELVVYGNQGKVVIPNANGATEARLYDRHDKLVEHYQDTETTNGFVYQIKEVMSCVRDGALQSVLVPHDLTIAGARLYDQIWRNKR